MATVTKKELITEISDKTGIKHADVALMLESFMEVAVNHLAAGDEITLRTFGTFDLRVAKGKLGRNPKLPRSEVMIPDRCVVRFRPSRELRSRAAVVPVHKVNAANGVNGM
jgi:nucleoid DNA-binding protein